MTIGYQDTTIIHEIIFQTDDEVYLGKYLHYLLKQLVVPLSSQ